MDNPIIFALDNLELTEAKELVQEISPYIGAVKIGLELFTKYGPKVIEEFTSLGQKIFLDLKFHDIPNTVAKAVAAASELDVFMMTIHTVCGREALQMAKSKLKGGQMLIGVSVLTSMNNQDLESIGVNRKTEEQVENLASLAFSSGLDGLVCSPHEIALLKNKFGKEIKLIVPGIRPKNSVQDDQKRVLSPIEALRNGADFLVIGRPISAAEDKVQAAKDIYLSIL